MARTKKRKYPKGVEFRVEAEQDDMSVRGNALASGDDEQDKEAEEEILQRLDRGDVWAWASVHVIAEYEGFRGDAYLGGCNYKDERDFMKDAYYEDMKSEAYDDLLDKMRRAGAAIQKFKKSGGSLAKDLAEIKALLK